MPSLCQVADLAKQLGVRCILKKPVRLEELAAILDHELRRTNDAVNLMQTWESPATFDDVATLHGRKLEEVNARWEAVIGFNLELSEETNPISVLEKSCLAVRKILGVRYAFIVANDIYAVDRQQYVSSGFERLGVVEFARFLSSQSMFERMIGAGRPYRVVLRTGGIPLPNDAQPAAGTFGLLATPILCPSRDQRRPEFQIRRALTSYSLPSPSLSATPAWRSNFRKTTESSPYLALSCFGFFRISHRTQDAQSDRR